MSDIAELLKHRLQPKGTLPVVAIGWQCSTTSAAYLSKEFVDQCIDEIDRVLLRATVLGEKATPLEQLAISMIAESAYYKDMAALAKAADEFRKWKENNAEPGRVE